VIRNRRILPLIAMAAVALPAVGRAQAIILQHQLTIYGDQKELGLSAPEGIACSNSALVIADTGNARLVKYAIADKQLGAGVPIKLEQLKRPTRAKALPDGRLLVLDEKTRSIVRIDATGAFVGRVEFKGDAAPKGVVPAAFDVDSSGTLFVLDVISRSVLALDASDSVTRKIELPKQRTTVFTDVAVDPAGTLYAIDAVGATVWSATKGQAEFTQLSKSLKDVIAFPIALTLARGSLLVVDQHGDGLVAVGLDGTYRGRQLAEGWTDGLVRYPSQVCVNAANELFLADRGNNRVQLFTVVR
jgi:DNA-binding beta-propeller fold protein YncE